VSSGPLNWGASKNMAKEKLEKPSRRSSPLKENRTNSSPKIILFKENLWRIYWMEIADFLAFFRTSATKECSK